MLASITNCNINKKLSSSHMAAYYIIPVRETRKKKKTLQIGNFQAWIWECLPLLNQPKKKGSAKWWRQSSQLLRIERRWRLFETNCAWEKAYGRTLVANRGWRTLIYRVDLAIEGTEWPLTQWRWKKLRCPEEVHAWHNTPDLASVS